MVRIIHHNACGIFKVGQVHIMYINRCLNFTYCSGNKHACTSCFVPEPSSICQLFHFLVVLVGACFGWVLETFCYIFYFYVTQVNLLNLIRFVPQFLVCL